MWSTVCDLVLLESIEQTITDAEKGIGISKRYDDIDEMFEDLNKDYPAETISHQNLSIDREPCKHCSNNPQNGGDGICFCILGTPTIY